MSAELPGGEYAVEHLIAAEHPCLAGHFPGRPLVPGVVIIERVVASARTWLGELRLVGVPDVKFRSPLSPDELLKIQLCLAQRRDGDGRQARLRFRCQHGARLVCSGVLEVELEPVS